MKVVILAGGFGTRISEESVLKPKPMIEINGDPILWHIMKYYSHYGFNEFIICLGYKGGLIKQFFSDYYMLMSDITFDFSKQGKQITHLNVAEPWKVTLADTGLDTMTGGRIKRVKDYIGDETFMLTYGDSVGDINLNALLDFHNKNNRFCTITAIRPQGRFGGLGINEENSIESFREKDPEDSGWINGGFMVVNPKVLDYIDGDKTVFEREPLETLARQNQLTAYKHNGFWQCMDTLRDKILLEKLLEEDKAPWKVWNNK
jgi:glucose-1-phosphate cytidylyltransferase